jgi:hypothetical protein
LSSLIAGSTPQLGIGTFREKGRVRALQVAAVEKIERSGGFGDEGDLDKRKLTAPYFFFLEIAALIPRIKIAP